MGRQAPPGWSVGMRRASLKCILHCCMPSHSSTGRGGGGGGGGGPTAQSPIHPSTHPPIPTHPPDVATSVGSSADRLFTARLPVMAA